MSLQQIQASLPGSVTRTCYAVVLQDSQFFNASLNSGAGALEAYNASDWTATKYCLTMTELGGNATSGIYYVNFPSSLPAGRYSVIVYSQAGVNPAISDTKVASGAIEWNGTAIVQIGVTIPAVATVTGNVDGNVEGSVASVAGQVSINPSQSLPGTSSLVTGSTGEALAAARALAIGKRVYDPISAISGTMAIYGSDGTLLLQQAVTIDSNGNVTLVQ